MKKIVIIGSGASGICAAIHAASSDTEVIVLEKNKISLKKLLITGAGRCNYFNDNFSKDKYNIDNILIDKVVSKKDDYLNFFDSIGIYPYIDNGYYYPYSNNAVSVQSALLTEAKHKGVKFIYEYEVLSIKEVNNKYQINHDIICDKIIISAGSNTYPNTGSTGEMYNILKDMGIKITKVLPALVQLKSNNKLCTNWPTIRIKSNVSLYIDDTLIKDEYGDLQLTNYGLSGICIMNLSREAVQGISNNKKVDIHINFLSMIDDYDAFINNRVSTLNKRNLLEIFEGVINYKLLLELFNAYKIDYKLSFDDLNNEKKDKIKEILTNLAINIEGYNDFTKSQVSQGGVSLEELNENFMLKKYKDIYCIGELVDIDGDCGGYNLTYAFISGMIAGGDTKND